MKLLFLTETNSAKKTMEEVLAGTSERLNMQMDIALTCGPIYTDKEMEKMTDAQLSPILEKDSDVSAENFWYDTTGSQPYIKDIAELVAKNKYDYIINACLPHAKGTVEFLHTIRTCGLTTVPLIVDPEKELGGMPYAAEITEALKGAGRILSESAYAKKLSSRDAAEYDQEI